MAKRKRKRSLDEADELRDELRSRMVAAVEDLGLFLDGEAHDIIDNMSELIVDDPRNAEAMLSNATEQRDVSAEDMAEWQREVAEGSTRLGVDDWLDHRAEARDEENSRG